MFTGIIEELGSVVKLTKTGESAAITIRAEKVLDDTKTGDSIAVNGVCLTVTELRTGQFTADIMPETVNRSSLGRLKQGEQVNLERAMALGERFGGHIVSGHIDGVGKINQVKSQGNAVWYSIKAPSSILRYLVEKGSVAIDGASLTVAESKGDYFSVSIIPHTLSKTILGVKQAGDTVNLENDVISKYVEKLCCPVEQQKTAKGGVTKELLFRAGF